MKKNYLFIAFIALVIGLSFGSCSKDDNNGSNNGKTDPNTIAAANLVAYFPFDGNGNDKISNMTPSNTSTTTVTFPAGRRGQCFQGTADGTTSGLLYSLAASSKLKTLKAFTVSVWTKMVPNTVETTDAPEQMLFQIDGTGDWIWGNLFLLQHRNWPLGETVQATNFAEMDCYFWKDDATAPAAIWKGQRGNGWFLDVVSPPKWRHIICTYDNATSEFHAYVDGVPVTAFDGTEYMGVNRLQGEGGAPLGNLKFVNANHLAIGAWYARLANDGLQPTDAWASPFKGQLDELRMYDRGLTATEAKALYDAEVSQIN